MDVQANVGIAKRSLPSNPVAGRGLAPPGADAAPGRGILPPEARGVLRGLSRPHCREDRRLPRLILSRPPELMTEAEREAFVFDLRMALRQVAPETWRDFDTRRLPVDDLVEKIVLAMADRILTGE